ncbi:hypothetical protein KEH51_14930 [[Brevibacterium] frigoritolerans]|uniref:Uncharacterized protein n=1 Tax=Peribacillus frigoritolerans TaxID=450367 RepID=A0A941FIY6_9BACI|nr:hypothetical protein [Peribacillus frigoritolerans]
MADNILHGFAIVYFLYSNYLDAGNPGAKGLNADEAGWMLSIMQLAVINQHSLCQF